MAEVTRVVLGRIALRHVPACALPAAPRVAAAAPSQPRSPAPAADTLRLTPAAVRAVLAYLAEG